jgi:hypothetical protein
MKIGYHKHITLINDIWDTIYATVHNDTTESDISHSGYLIGLLRMTVNNQVSEINNQITLKL